MVERMCVKLINIEVTTPAVTKFLHMFCFIDQADFYRKLMLAAMKDSWSKPFGNNSEGWIYGAVQVVAYGEVNDVLEFLDSEELNEYVAAHIGDFDLYASCKIAMPLRYVVDVPMLIDNDTDCDTWITLNLTLNNDFYVTQSRVAYYTDEISEDTLLDLLH